MSRPYKYHQLESDLGQAYCETLLEFQEHCEKTEQNFRQVMIDLIEAKLTDERRGKDAEDATEKGSPSNV